MLFDATIVCPHCGKSRQETMPERSFETRYVCSFCGKTLEPKNGDDCVFCSYSNTVCPPTQEKRDCCSG